MTTVSIPRGKILKITETSGNAASSVDVFYQKSGVQDSLYATISAGATAYMGPYLSETPVNLTTKGVARYTTSFVGEDQQVPVWGIRSMTTAEYAAITPDPTTLYVITDA